MTTIYGRANSVNVQAVMWCLAELGQPAERRDVGVGYGGNDTPEFLAMNPNGLVPVLRDERVTMFESCAILRYLAARYGQSSFWPEDLARRASVDMWAEWGKTTLQRNFLGPVFWHVVRTPADRRDPAALKSAIAVVDRDMGILEAQLGASDYVLGPVPTLADIVIGAQLYRYFTIEIVRPDRPVLAAYYARLAERPAYRRHVMVSYEALRVS